MVLTNTKNINLKKLERMAGLAIENGLRLHYDSILMFNNKSYSTAFYLSVLAIEEVGKALLIEHQWWHSIIDGRMTPQEEENWLKLIYNHKTKQLNFAYFVGGFDSDNRLFKELQSGSLDNLKQNSIYVGLKKQGKKIILDSKINNPLKITEKRAQKIITLLNDNLLVFCLSHANEAGGADAESITSQLDRNQYNKLTTLWPHIARKTKIRLKNIESL